MTNQEVRIELVTGVEDVTALRAPWETLWANTPGARWSQHASMCAMTAEAVQRKSGRRLSVVTAWRGGSLVGVLPLMSWSLFFISMFMSPMVAGMECCTALMAGDEDAEQLAHGMLGQLMAHAPAAIVRLPSLRSETPFAAAILKRKDGVTLHTMVSSVLSRDVGGSWDEYLASKRTKEQMRVDRRRLRQLGDLGSLEFERVSTPAEQKEALEWLIRLKTDWLVKTGRGVKYFFEADAVDLIERQLSANDPNHGFRIYRLLLDGKTVAVQLAVIGNGSLDLLAVVHDKAFDKFSVGKIIVDHVMKAAFEEGLDIELGFGDDDWKKVLRTHQSRVLWVDLFSGVTAAVIPFYERLLPIYHKIPGWKGWVSRQLGKLTRLPRRLIRSN